MYEWGKGSSISVRSDDWQRLMQSFFPFGKLTTRTGPHVFWLDVHEKVTTSPAAVATTGFESKIVVVQDVVPGSVATGITPEILRKDERRLKDKST